MADPSPTGPRRLLVHLPGYDDSARDLYETTPALDNGDAGTAALPRAEAQGDASPADSEEEGDEEDESGISRRRLFPATARRAFVDSGVEGRKVDLSDRVDGGRRGYRVRARKGAGAGEDEEEGLEQRLARLRREVEECRVLAEREGELDFGGREEGYVGEVEELGRLIAGVEVRGAVVPSAAAGAGNGVSGKGGGAGGAATPGAWPDADDADGGGEATDAQLLARVTDFDARLSALEQSLGISALDSITSDSSSLSLPVLPSLTLLDAQLAALTSASSLTTLETAAARIQKLRAAADTLQQPAQFPSTSTSSSRPATAASNPTPDSETSPALNPTDLTQLRTLYTLLPTLQSLHPTLPPLLTRLRSLRTLHASAASAASELDEAETRLQQMEAELKAWRTGMETVEAAVKEAGEANGRNGGVVEGWVKALEGRVRAG